MDNSSLIIFSKAFTSFGSHVEMKYLHIIYNYILFNRPIRNLLLRYTNWPDSWHYYYYFKTSRKGPSLKNRVVNKLLSQPHKHLCHGKLNKTQLREATNSRLHPWTHPAFGCETHCREGQSTFELGPAGYILQIGAFFNLIIQTPMDKLRSQLGYVEL